MKAVILEKLNQECIVLAEDESMHTIPAPAGLDVGDVVNLTAYLRRQRSSRKRWQRAVAAAAVMLVALCGTFYYTTFTVSATVTTEGEAPIVYYLNHRGQVLRAEALNKEGEEVLKSMGGVENRPDLEDVLTRTETVMQEKGYLAEDEHLTFTTDKDKDGKADETDTVRPTAAQSGKTPAKKETTEQRQANPTKNSNGTKPSASQKPSANTPGKDPAQPTSGSGGGDRPGEQGGDNGGQIGGGSGGGDSGGSNGTDPGSGGSGSDTPGGNGGSDSGGNGGGQNPPGKDSGSGGNSGGAGGQKPPADNGGGEGGEN